MKDKYEDILVSTKNVKKRLIIFIIAIVVAVGSFTVGIIGYGSKEAGFHEVTVTPDEDAPTYGSGYSFFYWFEGTSGEIKEKYDLLQTQYSNSLARIIKLLDAENIYDGYKNIAYLNAHVGEDVDIPEELYEVLKDAADRSGEGVYELFSAPLYRFWKSVLILENAPEYDPLVNGDIAERIEMLASELCKEGIAEICFLNDTTHTVRLEVSDEYERFRRENEVDSPVLDLGIMSDAYAVTLLYRELDRLGYDTGYILHESGISVCLGDGVNGAYHLYGYDNGSVRNLADINMRADTAYCVFTSFLSGTDKYDHYVISVGGKEHLRCPYITPDGTFPELLCSASCLADKGNAAEAAYSALKLFAAKSREDLKDITLALSGSGIITSYTEEQNGTALYISEADAPLLVMSYGETEIHKIKKDGE